ncbi:transcription-repair coupling factor [Arboricoccus pini]|uniref:Transcription-repair-coupling factor n=1 Tax=Arboricoccus pini TaxID=1963835 RepID=A0A212QNM1_9PROT|nr:transcription-repair coupling factor [Arboricoccus pini]SNB60821.1 transcription-repair coupling factor [Arboricoccus pini]
MTPSGSIQDGDVVESVAESFAAELAAESLPTRTLLSASRDGLEARFVVQRLTSGDASTILFIARDQPRLIQLEKLAHFFAPQVQVLNLPAWDCVPYDRISPNGEVMAARLRTLAALLHPADQAPKLILTTANAVLQRLPPAEAVAAGHFTARTGTRVDREDLIRHLERNGYRRAGTVVETGEYAVRGGLLDVFPTGAKAPVRLDFFGSTIESIRRFDPLTQRSAGKEQQLELGAVSEVVLDDAAIERFRTRYLQTFGAVGSSDPLLESVQSGRPFPGMEHWLPLFHDSLATLFDYLPADCELAFDHLAREGVLARATLIGEHYEARRTPEPTGSTFGTVPYRALPPDALYIDEQSFERAARERRSFQFSIFNAPPAIPKGYDEVIDLHGRPARDFATERATRDTNLFDAIVRHLRELLGRKAKPLIAVASNGAAERLQQVLEDHGAEGLSRAETFAEARRLPGVVIVVLPLDHGVIADDGLHILSEQDLLGDRIARAARKSRRADKFIADLTQLAEGDLVVHAEHGIGRFDGLVTLEIGGAPHDVLKLIYAGNDKLFVPVENLEILSRYGSGEEGGALDKLGGVGWQQRKAKAKERIRELAGELIKVAAERAMRKGQPIDLAHGIYDEFAARFPFEETEDQLRAIESVLGDMASGHPMDRLVCGDVGFGKTEVAIRAAFVVAMSGRQVAMLAPTTLLARQHFNVFSQRFAGMPIRVAQLSRFVTAKEMDKTKKAMIAGEVDIVVGTHALLSKGVAFKDLGLVIIDEEQHFGVAAKEKLKQLRAEVHVLTMTATPIPRTLHMALGGMKDLSIIATPPVDRLAVRSFVTPTDPVVLRDAILREYHRGGQCFYVCPRVADQTKLRQDLEALVPEIKIAVANGQMAPAVLEAVMNDFYDGKVDLLLATNIVESGLDIPRANTLIVHRADLFGLSQLYQLRGRVGRSKVRGYAYFTVPSERTLADTAEKRLQIIQSLDGLGAGFHLASHDLDIRGAGNLLGDEQSGQIKEVGFELYNQMLEEAVTELRRAAKDAEQSASSATDWTPQITVDAAALMPESYIGDLDLRLSMYRRLASLQEADELDAFAAELVDRFGKMPIETRQLIEIVGIKQLCRRANVAKLDAGPKGIVATFHENRFPRPDRLVGWIANSKGQMRVRPDHRLVMMRETQSPPERLKAARFLASELAKLAT